MCSARYLPLFRRCRLFPSLYAIRRLLAAEEVYAVYSLSFKLVPIAKLDGTDLGHMKWLKEYQNYEVSLVGDDELIVGRSWQIQMLYEFNIMDVGRLSRDWFRILVGDTIDYTEVKGWRKTGRPKQANPSFTELKTVRCIIHGPQLEDIYKIAEMSKSSVGVKTIALTSSLLEGGMESGTKSELTDEIVEEILGMREIKSSDESMMYEFDPNSPRRTL